MRPGRELDVAIAKQVFGHNVKVKKKELWEDAPKGERPLRKYSSDVEATWEVIEKMKISLIPISDGTWFAMVGTGQGWKSPADFFQYLQTGHFVNAGAAVGENLPLTVCIAAIKAVEHRHSALATEPQSPNTPTQTH
jgi:hypothetical protein